MFGLQSSDIKLACLRKSTSCAVYGVWLKPYGAGDFETKSGVSLSGEWGIYMGIGSLIEG